MSTRPRQNLEPQLLHLLARAVERMGDPVEIAGPEGRLLYVNPAFERRTGYTLDEVIGRTLGQLLRAGDNGPELNETVWGALARGEDWKGRISSRAKDGSSIEFEIFASPIFDDEGGIANVVAVRREIDHRERLQTELLQADRLAAMGQLAAGVAHGINNPLSFVLANLTFMGRELENLRAHVPAGQIAEMDALLSDAHQGATRIRDIVRDLKSFTLSESQERVLDLNGIIEIAVKMATPEIRHVARLVRSYSETPPIWGHESRLRQVFLNLLVNAAQSISNVGKANEISVSTGVDPDGTVLVTIRDTGEGIVYEDLERVFEPFYTTRAGGEGTGLGLSIARHVVVSMGGRIEIETQAGEGTAVTVRLPAWRGAEVPADDRVTPIEERRARVLIIDDEPLVARALTRILSAHRVEVCQNGRDALERLSAETFDVVLCDLMMPQVSGMAVYQQAVIERPELARRFVFVTGGAFTRESRAFLEATANPSVEKPFSPEEIIDAVQRVLDAG